MLGLAYYDGKLTKRNDLKALGWFREATRNGHYPSYFNAGKILAEGSEDVP